MRKPIVFISHISEEKDMAIRLKTLIEDSFLGMMEVFVSSDENCIGSGSRWLDDVSYALENCIIELILCSPKSVKRPWINFEAGAGWVRKIDVIPLCHSGMETSNLPIPLNLLQAVKISELASIKLIFPVLAKAIEANCPKVFFDDFIADMKEFEKKYMFWDEINNCLNAFRQKYKEIFNMVYEKQTRFQLEEIEISDLQRVLKPLIDRGYVSVMRTGGGTLSPTKMVYCTEIKGTDEYYELLNDEHCIIHKLEKR